MRAPSRQAFQHPALVAQGVSMAADYERLHKEAMASVFFMHENVSRTLSRFFEDTLTFLGFEWWQLDDVPTIRSITSALFDAAHDAECRFSFLYDEPPRLLPNVAEVARMGRTL